MYSDQSETRVTQFQRLGIQFVHLENSLEILDVPLPPGVQPGGSKEPAGTLLSVSPGYFLSGR